MTRVMHDAAKAVRSAAAVPTGRDAAAWKAHWALCALSAYRRADLASLQSALRQVPEATSHFLDVQGLPHDSMGVEAFEAMLRQLRAQQVEAGLQHDLSAEPDQAARRALRARAQRRLSSLSPSSRAVHSIVVVGDDGQPASSTTASACMLAAHWGRIFAEGDPPDEDAMHRLLQPLPAWRDLATLMPPDFDSFAEVVAHSRHSAPGPDGGPFFRLGCDGSEPRPAPLPRVPRAPRRGADSCLGECLAHGVLAQGHAGH